MPLRSIAAKEQKAPYDALIKTEILDFSVVENRKKTVHETPGDEGVSKSIIHVPIPAGADEDVLYDFYYNGYRNAMKVAMEKDYTSVCFDLLENGENAPVLAALDGFFMPGNLNTYLIISKAYDIEKIQKDLDEYFKQHYKKEAGDDSRKYEESFTRKQPTVPVLSFIGTRKELTADEKRELKNEIKKMDYNFAEYITELWEGGKIDKDYFNKHSGIDRRKIYRLRSEPGYHPDRLTAMKYCFGMRLSYDESKELLSRAGYSLSTSNMTDIIFSFLIKREIYDVQLFNEYLYDYGEKTTSIDR